MFRYLHRPLTLAKWDLHDANVVLPTSLHFLSLSKAVNVIGVHFVRPIPQFIRMTLLIWDAMVVELVLLEGRNCVLDLMSLLPLVNIAKMVCFLWSLRLCFSSMSRIKASIAVCWICCAQICLLCLNIFQGDSYKVDSLFNFLQFSREFNAPKSAIKIALATYDQAIHFYDLSTTYQPQMSILSDVNDLFVPFVEGFFVDYEIAKANLSRYTFFHTN